tara:strand:+ start:369 stop:1136 length:768 start_codon:yes stop_codon:yes gene_type:complete
MVSQKKLDSPDREKSITLALKKGFLKKFYLEIYQKYSSILLNTHSDGIALELGSGCGFVKTVIPEIVTSDVIYYSSVDKIVDATSMPFEDKKLKAIFMLNVLHHVSNSTAAFHEFSRCMTNGGKIFIVDQYPGIPARWIYKFAHHEPFNEYSQNWDFDSVGPLSGANGALAWIIFYRDREKFEKLYPELKIRKIEVHSPLRYWLAGGLKKCSLLPGSFFYIATLLDRVLIKIWPGFGSFVDIEIEKIDQIEEGKK